MDRPPMPRWVKVFGVVALIAVLVLVVALLTGGEHGPGRHTGGGSGEAAPAHTPPPEHAP